MKRVIVLGKEARKKLKEGITKAAEAIRPTLGPKGCSALIYTKSVGIPLVIDDGATIARILQDDDPVVNAGVSLINEAASQADSAGDGSSTCSIFASEIINEAVNAVESGSSQKQLKTGIELGAKLAINYIREKSRNVKDDKDLFNIAHVSANDENMATLISSAVSKVGRNGIIHVENGNGIETTVDLVSGMKFERGYLSRFFVNRPDKSTFELNNCKILLLDHTFYSSEDAKNLLITMAKKGFGLLVIADQVDEAVMSWFMANAQQARLKVCAIKAPGHGDLKKAYLQDIAAMTGATILGDTTGIELDKLRPEEDPSTMDSYTELFGTANVIVSQNNTVIMVDQLSKDAEEHLKALNEQLKVAETPYEAETLKDRIANITGSVAIIHVGGYTDTEVEARKAKLEDAKNATKAALEEGYVCGGGSIYLAASLYLEKFLATADTSTPDINRGIKIVANALTKITKQLGDNSNDVGDIIVRDVKTALMKEDDPCTGYNAATNKIVNMYEDGVIDSTKVIVNSLQKAASIASTVIMTATVVTEQTEESDKINWALAQGQRR